MEPFTFRPNKAQELFLSSNADIVQIGGNLGGGKSFAIILGMLRANESPTPGYLHPKYNAILIRKNYKDLADLIMKSEELYPKVDPKAVFNRTELIWKFSSGAKIRFAYFDNINSARSQLTGQEYTTAGIDELNVFEDPEIFTFLLTRLRNTFNMQTKMLCTANPSRYRWIKDFFRIPDNGASTTYYNEYTLSDGKVYKQKIQYIQALLKDNQFLPKEYEMNLQHLEEKDKQALLYGDWAAYLTVDGAVYGEEMTTMKKQNQICRVNYDPALSTFVALDLGYNDSTALSFFQIQGKEVRIFDHYENSNHHISHYIDIIKQKGYNNIKIILPHDARAKKVDAEYSVEQQFISSFSDRSILVLSRESIELGISEVKNMFKNTYINSELTRLIECLESYKRKMSKTTGTYGEVLHDQYSNTADSIRYVAMFIKSEYKSEEPTKLKPMMYNPLSYGI